MEVVLTSENFEILSNGKLIKRIPRKQTYHNAIQAVDFNQRIFCTMYENGSSNHIFYQIDDVKWEINELTTKFFSTRNSIFYPRYGYIINNDFGLIDKRWSNCGRISHIENGKFVEKFKLLTDKIKYISRDYVFTESNFYNINTGAIVYTNFSFWSKDDIIGLSEDNFLICKKRDHKTPAYNIFMICDNKIKSVNRYISGDIKILPDATIIKNKNGKEVYYRVSKQGLHRIKKENLYQHSRECINFHISTILETFPKVLIDIISNFF